jgi:4-hydroxy-tetrahydrodipicolinate synthase
LHSFFGSLVTAMITPFNPNLEINYQKVEELVEILLQKGSDSLVVAGTTGESPALSEKERLNLFKVVANVAKGRAKILAGAGGNYTRTTIELCQKAEKMGIDGLMLVTPYYNKPPQEGLYRHFAQIAKSVSLPIMLYNVPSRTGINLQAETTLRLAEIDNIIAIKEASGDLEQVTTICAGSPDNFFVYSGDDSMTLPIISAGGSGVVSIASHLAGLEIKQMMEAFFNRDVDTAIKMHQKLMPLFKALFITTNPIPLKAALNLSGMDVGEPRLPLISLPEKLTKTLKEVLDRYTFN